MRNLTERLYVCFCEQPVTIVLSSFEFSLLGDMTNITFGTFEDIGSLMYIKKVAVPTLVLTRHVNVNLRKQGD